MAEQHYESKLTACIFIAINQTKLVQVEYKAMLFIYHANVSRFLCRST